MTVRPTFRAAMLAAVALFCLFSGLLVPRAARAGFGDDLSAPGGKEPPPPCSEDCFQLAHLSIRGGVTTTLTF